MGLPHIVIDTSVLIAALRSKRGAAYRLLRLIGTGAFEVHISVPLVLEYEAAAYRMVDEIPLTPSDIDAIVDYVCAIGQHEQIFYLWRPFLRDAEDDMVLELTVTGRCSHIVTYNVRDFAGTERFGLQVVDPGIFLREIGVL